MKPVRHRRHLPSAAGPPPPGFTTDRARPPGYPLSPVPDEYPAGLVRALLTTDRNQRFLRLQMTPRQRR